MNYDMYDYCSLRDALRIDAVYEGVKKFCYGELFEDLVKRVIRTMPGELLIVWFVDILDKTL